MEKFTTFRGVVAPLDRTNVDTDAIIPKQFLKSINRAGFGVNLFDAWRFIDPGEPGKHPDDRKINPDFVLNKKKYQDATILLSRDNFGCGSSREHAPWALVDYGFRVIIAPSFADIFYNNSLKNGLLPVVLSGSVVDQLFKNEEVSSTYSLTINLRECYVKTDCGEKFSFSIDQFRRHCLLEGLDDIGITLTHADDIKAFERNQKSHQPWLYE